MSLKSMPIPPVPEKTAHVAHAVFPRGNVLSEFSSRLVAGNAGRRLLDLLLEQCQEKGWHKAHGRQRTYSTHLLAKICVLNRVLCVAQTMVYVLNVLAEVSPEWVRVYVPVEWVEHYGEWLEHERLPKEEEERKQYANQAGADGWTLLQAASCFRYSGLAQNPARRHDAAHQSLSSSLTHEKRVAVAR